MIFTVGAASKITYEISTGHTMNLTLFSDERSTSHLCGYGIKVLAGRLLFFLVLRFLV
jgi:hypothetical protein